MGLNVMSETLAETEVTGHFDSNYSEQPGIHIYEPVPCKFSLSVISPDDG